MRKLQNIQRIAKRLGVNVAFGGKVMCPYPDAFWGYACGAPEGTYPFPQKEPANA